MKSVVIFENSHYVACAMRDGSLCVTGKRRKVGQPGYNIRLIGDTAAYWIKRIRVAAAWDASEASALCRALMPAPSDRIRR